MIKTLKILIITVLFSSCTSIKEHPNTIISTDVTNFWEAYDKIKKTKDSTQQINYLKELFLDKGTAGLKAIMEARRYTADSYMKAIHKYPKFWETIRPNTLKINGYKEAIHNGIEHFKNLYPEARPAIIYFTIGALKTGGTTMDDKVLIGSEVALGDLSVNASELKRDFPNLLNHFKLNVPDESIVFGNVHEYVHTQQDTTIANSLLSKTLIEGVGEFVAEKSLNIASPNESVIYGKQHDKKIKDAFVKEMFTKFEIRWFWSNTNNQFKVGDLGYYVGYAICKSYYEQVKDKKLAIKEMIELDYLDEDEVCKFIDASKYFEKPIAIYKKEFERHRPRVIGISEFENNSAKVDTAIKTMTLKFSKAMDTTMVNLRIGPLGKNNLLEITDIVGWSKDKKKITYKIALQPNLRQQLLVTDIFRSKDGYLLAPYLVDITTK